MRVFRFAILLLPALFQPGCSADKTPPPPPPDKNVFDPLTQQMDRARQVQGTVDDQAQATRKRIEAAEGGNDAAQ